MTVDVSDHAKLRYMQRAGAAVDAAVCGAAGCRETDGLLKLVVDGSQRVLCENHASEFLEVAA